WLPSLREECPRQFRDPPPVVCLGRTPISPRRRNSGTRSREAALKRICPRDSGRCLIGAGRRVISGPPRPSPESRPPMDAAVIVFPGSNREQDIMDALRRSSGKEPRRVWHGDTELPKTDLIVIPGGFAYGDYLRCGAMAAHSPIMREVRERAARGTPVLGVC